MIGYSLLREGENGGGGGGGVISRNAIKGKLFSLCEKMMLLYVIKSKLQSLSKVQGLIDWLFSVARGGKMGGGGGSYFP